MLMRALKDQDGPIIDFTPMIDMVFNLLIFFLVATTFHQTEREMQIALPQASSAAPLTSLMRELVVNVTVDGSVILSGRTVSEDDLRLVVHEAVARNPEQKVTIRGDRATAYANIMRVLDLCKSSGINEPFLDTVPVN